MSFLGLTNTKTNSLTKILTAPLFAVVIGISIWNFADPHNFNILWHWFAWSNQVLAAISLWVATGYLVKTSKNRYISFFTSIPALFMTMVVVTYFFTERQFIMGQYFAYYIGVLHGVGVSLAIFIFYLVRMIHFREPLKENDIKEPIDK